MRFESAVAAIVCLVSTFSNSAFAVGSDGLKASNAKSNTLAVVRIENDQIKCVQYAAGVKTNTSQLHIPLCKNEGETGAQTESVMSMAKNGGNQRTAILSHIGAVIGGCAFSTVAILSIDSKASYVDKSDIENYNYSGLTDILAGVTLGSSALLTLVSEPTGHGIATAAGIFLCGRGVSYLVLDKASDKVSQQEKIRADFYQFLKEVSITEETVLESWRDASLDPVALKAILQKSAEKAIDLKVQARTLKASAKDVSLGKYWGPLSEQYDALLGDRIPALSRRITEMWNTLDQESTR